MTKADQHNPLADASPSSTEGQVFRRSDRFSKAPNVTLADLAQPKTISHVPNPYVAAAQEELETLILNRQMWRYHHDLPFLSNPVNPKTLHSAYARRVETMFTMLHDGLAWAGISDCFKNISVCDLACAEGFVADHLISAGLEALDCYELNLDQIARFHMVQAYKRRYAAQIYRIDLERPFWALESGNQYDLCLCLGIVYHMENPMLFLRNVYEFTKHVAVIESDTPLSGGDKGVCEQWDQQVTLRPGEARYILEQRPNRKALVDMLLTVGFSEVYVVPPPPDAACPYLKSGTKTVVVAIKSRAEFDSDI